MEGEERNRVRAVQMDNLRGLLGIRRMDRVLNAWIRELCGVQKGLSERCSLVVWPCGEDGEGYECQKCLCKRVCW